MSPMVELLCADYLRLFTLTSDRTGERPDRLHRCLEATSEAALQIDRAGAGSHVSNAFSKNGVGLLCCKQDAVAACLH